MMRDPSVSTPDQRPERHHSLSIDDMSSSTAALLRDRNLSDQEAKVAFALYGDYSTARMAQALGISRSTAGTYCSRLYAKLGVANRAEARSALVRILGPTEDYLRKDEGRRRWVPRSTLTASVSFGITVSGIGVLIASLCTSPSFPSTWTISRIGPMPPPCLILLGLACIAFAHTPRRRRTSWQYEACSACSGLALLILVQDLFSPIRRTICGRLVEGGFGFAVYTILVAALIVYAVVHFSTISANIHLGLSALACLAFAAPIIVILEIGVPDRVAALLFMSATVLSGQASLRTGPVVLQPDHRPARRQNRLSKVQKALIGLLGFLFAHVVSLGGRPAVEVISGWHLLSFACVAVLIALCALLQHAYRRGAIGLDALLSEIVGWVLMGFGTSSALAHVPQMQDALSKPPFAQMFAVLLLLTAAGIATDLLIRHIGRKRYDALDEKDRLMTALAWHAVQLTQSEYRVLARVLHGDSIEEAAARLCVTKATVNTHLAHIYRKLGVHSLPELRATIRDMIASCARRAAFALGGIGGTGGRRRG